jgi:hypothetical protein
VISRHVQEEIRALDRRQGQISAFERDFDDRTPRDLVAIQANFDETYRALGVQAPLPGRPGEGPREYAGRLVAGLLPYTQTFRSSNPYAIAGTPVEADVRREIAAAISDPRRGDLLTGAGLRPVTTTEDGVTAVRWHGTDTSWMRQFMPPYQIAKEIKTFDRSGNVTLPVLKWGHPPRRRPIRS